MKSYKVIPQADGTSDVVKQPGTIRKVWHWYWSALLYLVAWSILWQQPVFVCVMAVVCLVAEKGIKAHLAAKRSVGGGR